MKHTKGPWTVMSEIRGLETSYFINQYSEGNRSTIAYEIDSETNAQLIAAAPELLEAIQNNLKLLEAIERETGYVTTVTQLHLQKLIAKAEGK